jgi:hypothetical protein
MMYLTSRISTACAVFALCILIFPFSGLTQEEIEIPGFSLLDFDGDGISDITVLEDQNDGSPNELVYTHRESSTGNFSSPVEFGKSQDIPVLGDYDGDGLTDLVVVREEDEQLNWISRDDEGDTSQVTFGVVGDFVLGGCDFDADGTADEAVFRTDEGLLYLDAQDSPAIIPALLGEGETPVKASCGDLNNDGTWELLLIIQDEKKYALVVFDIEGEELFRTTTKNPTDMFLFDNDGDGFLDVGLYRKKKRRALFQLFSGNESLNLTKGKIRIRGGRKTQRATALYDGSRAEWSLLFYGKRGRLFFQDENSNRIVRASIANMNGDELILPQNSEQTGASEVEDPSGLCSTVEDMADGANGRLWKDGDHGGVVALFTRRDGYRAKRVRIMHQGEFLYTMEYTGEANPDEAGPRSHWRDRAHRGSYYPAGIILVVTTTANDTHCYRVDNPGRRTD